MADVLVLGANGFVGRHLTEALARGGPHRPVALVRGPGAGFPAGVEVRRADATDAVALRAALAGVRAAVNCIAGDPDAMVAATRALCAEAEAAGTMRVVHLSSMAVYGPATGLVSESQPLDPSAGEYGRAKVECERVVDAHVAAGGDAVTLRPGIIHGPGSQQWTGRIGRLLARHRIGDLGAAGDGACNLTAVSDMVAAIGAALDRADARGRAFNVSDPDPGTWNEYFLRLGRAIGAVPVRRISPRWLKAEKLLAVPLKLSEVATGKLRLRSPLPEPIPPSLLRAWAQDIVLDHRAADAGLGFARTDPAQAIAAAAAWFRARG